jgi:hypothetical protein
VTLTGATDAFFSAQRLATFGDLGEELKTHVQAYQARSVAHAPGAIASIADMKRFVEEYPEVRRLGGNVSKHVALVGELSRLVERDRLLDVGEVEQGLATGSGADLRVSISEQHINSALTRSAERAGPDHEPGCHSGKQAAPGYALCTPIPEDAGGQHRRAHQTCP